MFGNLFGRLGLGGFGCGCEGKHGSNSSCDVLWIIILLMIVFRGDMFGLDICTLVILFIVFGKDLLGCGCEKKCEAHC